MTGGTTTVDHRALTCRGLRAAATAVALLTAAGLTALDSPSAIEEYRGRTWSLAQGLPQASANAIVQDRDGYLWIATFGGLARFDGVRFEVSTTANAPGLPSDRLLALLVDRTGALWVGSERQGVARRGTSGFERVSEVEGRPLGGIATLVEGPSGTIWAGTASELVRLAPDGMRRRWGAADGLPRGPVWAVLDEPGGPVWIGTAGGLARLDGDRVESVAVPGHPDLAVRALLRSRVDRTLWLGTGSGLFGLAEDGSLRRPGIVDGAGQAGVRSLLEDRHGSLWIGLDPGGLVRLRAGGVERYPAADDPAMGAVASLFEDVEGLIWVGTTGDGVHRLAAGDAVAVPVTGDLRGSPVLPVVGDGGAGLWVGLYCGGLVHLEPDRRTVYDEDDGLASVCVGALLRDGDGTLWVGTAGGGLHRLRAGRLGPLGGPDTPERAVRAVHRSRDGSLLVGTDGGVFRWRDDTGDFEPVPGASGLDVYRLAEDPSGEVWAGTLDGVRVLTPGGAVVPPGAEAVAGALVREVHFSGGAVWLGTYGSGLHRIEGGRTRRLGTGDGLPEDVVSRVLEDRNGVFWMTGNRGVTRVRRAELDEVAEGRRRRVEATLYGEADGMPTSECNGGGQPAGWLADDGMAWVPTIRGLARFDTGRTDALRPPPRVLVEQVVAGGREAAAGAPVRLSPGARELEVRYTAPTFVAPDRVRFRTRLAGLDGDWVDAGGRRTARYPYLPPGRYAFTVSARTEDSPWSPPSPPVVVTVDPRFVETAWFPLLLGGLAAGLAGLVAFARLAAVRTHERQLESEVASRTAELERLGELAERVNTALRLEDVLDHVYSSFRPAIPYDRIGFAEIEPDGRTIRATWARGENDGATRLEIGYRAPLAGSSLARVLETGEPRILGDLERYLAEHPESESTRRIVADGLRSSLTCPLTAMGRPVGFLFFSSRERNAYTADHVRFFQRIARQLSQSVERSRLYDDLLETQRQLEGAYVELERLAAADSLTGLANRRSFDAGLELEWRRCARIGTSLAVLLLDVDHFKQLNDAVGHGAGDQCLRRVAGALAGSLRRAGELVARYGGEEFVALLPDTGIEEAASAGERLRAAVAELVIEHPGSPLGRFVTISVGVAAVVPEPGAAPQQLLEAADRALYRAKQGGRDRVEVAG